MISVNVQAQQSAFERQPTNVISRTVTAMTLRFLQG